MMQKRNDEERAKMRQQLDKLRQEHKAMRTMAGEIQAWRDAEKKRRYEEQVRRTARDSTNLARSSRTGGSVAPDHSHRPDEVRRESAAGVRSQAEELQTLREAKIGSRGDWPLAVPLPLSAATRSGHGDAQRHVEAGQREGRNDATLGAGVDRSVPPWERENIPSDHSTATQRPSDTVPGEGDSREVRVGTGPAAQPGRFEKKRRNG